jgi:cytochrome c-type biogenesis protein CcmH/NrfF
VRRAVVVAVLALMLLPSAASAVKQRTSMSVILPEVMCVTCKIPLEVAQSPQADSERTYIQQLIDRGDTEAQIKRALVNTYGPEVLALPPASGFNIAVYLVPIAVLALLAGVLVLLLPQWRTNLRRARSAAPEGPSVLAPEDAARLESDLSRYDDPGRQRAPR